MDPALDAGEELIHPWTHLDDLFEDLGLLLQIRLVSEDTQHEFFGLAAYKFLPSFLEVENAEILLDGCL